MLWLFYIIMRAQSPLHTLSDFFAWLRTATDLKDFSIYEIY